MRLALVVAVMLLVSGCATGIGVTSMSPEQLMEFAKIKDSTITCIKGVYAGVTITTTFVNVDSVKAAPAGVVVKDDCSITYTGKGAAP